MSIAWHLRVDEDVLRPALNSAQVTNRLIRRAVILPCCMNSSQGVTSAASCICMQDLVAILDQYCI